MLHLRRRRSGAGARGGHGRGGAEEPMSLTEVGLFGILSILFLGVSIYTLGLRLG